MVSIHTNLSNLIAQGSLTKSTNTLNRAIEQMSTGYKINHASDNAANYSIKTNMDTKIGAYMVAEENVSMGIDLVTTASDSVQEIQNNAERLRSLCVKAKNGTYGTQSLSAINSEAESIVAEINRIYSTAKYNGISLFSNTTGNSQAIAQAEATPEVATFGLTRSANSEGKFIDDPVTYTDEEIEAMLANGDIVALDNNVTTFTSGQKYLISDETQLVRLATLVNSGKSGSGATFILGSDIDLGAYCDQEIANGNGGWTPIGKFCREFKGTFDGNGHVIKNLKIDREDDYQGLFGFTNTGSKIKNVGIEDGSVKGRSGLGGLVGFSSSSISNSYATGDVTGTGDHVGGLVGGSHSPISNSYATGSVSGTGGYVGGLVGNSEFSITNSYATGSVTGTHNVGGLAGDSDDSITNCYATGSVSGTGDFVGGLVAFSQGFITNCYATGVVTGNHRVGGLVGSSRSDITNSYATGSDTGSYCVGGLAGEADSDSDITNSYAIGSATGSSFVGGLVGEASSSFSSITNSYATGVVTGTDYVGGLAGHYHSSGTYTNNASVQTDTKATQMTEEEILSASNLESMGFTEAQGWKIVDGYNHPLLSWQKEAQSGSGTGGFAMALQVGIYGNGSSQIGFDINLSYDLSAVLADISSDEALDTIDNFINLLSEKQTHFGSVQNRLMSVLDEITIQRDNLVSSLSTIRDADMAEVSSAYIQQQILQQASATLMATANQTPAIALQLI